MRPLRGGAALDDCAIAIVYAIGYMRSPSILRTKRMIAGVVTVVSRIVKAKFGCKVLPVGMP